MMFKSYNLVDGLLLKCVSPTKKTKITFHWFSLLSSIRMILCWTVKKITCWVSLLWVAFLLLVSCYMYNNIIRCTERQLQKTSKMTTLVDIRMWSSAFTCKTLVGHLKLRSFSRDSAVCHSTSWYGQELFPLGRWLAASHLIETILHSPVKHRPPSANCQHYEARLLRKEYNTKTVLALLTY